MPLLKIETNLPRDQIPENFLKEATDLLSSELAKPSSYVCVQVSPDQVMSFGGTTEPCANITLNCIGVVGPDKNRQLAPVLSKFVEKQLGIKQESATFEPDHGNSGFWRYNNFALNQRFEARYTVNFRRVFSLQNTQAKIQTADSTSISLTLQGLIVFGTEAPLDKL